MKILIVIIIVSIFVVGTGGVVLYQKKKNKVSVKGDNNKTENDKNVIIIKNTVDNLELITSTIEDIHRRLIILENKCNSLPEM